MITPEQWQNDVDVYDFSAYQNYQILNGQGKWIDAQSNSSIWWCIDNNALNEVKAKD